LIHAWLEKLVRILDIDRASVWEIASDAATVYRRHTYSVTGYEAMPPVMPLRQYPWLAEQYRHEKAIVWSRIPEDMPPEAEAEREHALRVGAKSVLSIPIATHAHICVMALIAVRKAHKWSPALVQRLRLVGEIFTSAVRRQQTEIALSSSEARNRAILRALPDLMFVLSHDGVYLDYHSRDGSELLLPPEQFLGRNLHEILPQPLAAEFQAAIGRTAATGEVVRIEYTLPIQGEPRAYEARMVRRDDGAIVSTVRNVTERKRAEHRLRESEERFRGAFAHSAIGIAVVSLDGRWLQVNPALCNISGYSEPELLATTFQAITAAEDLGIEIEFVRRALEGEIDHYDLEKRYVHKEGRMVSALVTVSLVRDAGRPLYFVFQVQDITERKKAQMEIERLRLDLNRFGRLALTGQLTASLAHEVMQPITAVLGNAEAGLRLISTGRDEQEETQAILGDIVASCRRAAGVIEHVRGFLRKERKPHRRLDLNRLVLEVVAVMRSDMILRQVRLTTRLDASLPEIEGDPIELQQVIVNLLLNGAEAVSHNATHERDLVLTTERRDREIELSVRDRGGGAQPAHLRQMFEPFFTTKPDGMGMGLPICADIVRAHGGRLWAENNESGGMTMHCLLPVKARRERRRRAAARNGAAASDNT
jgi:PAS domain S-box-containing protein